MNLQQVRPKRQLHRILLGIFATLALILGGLAIPIGGGVLPKADAQTELDPTATRYVGANPDLTKKCGLNIALVFDLSGSIGELGTVKSKEAGIQFLDALAGSPANVGIFNFATFAPANMYAEQTAPVSMFTPESAQPAYDAVNALQATTSVASATNWDGGLAQVADSGVHYDVVYFITDGVPTTNQTQSNGSTDSNEGIITHEGDVNFAIDSANRLKEQGTRIVPIAIGLEQLATQPVFKWGVSRENTTTREGSVNYWYAGDYYYPAGFYPYDIGPGRPVYNSWFTDQMASGDLWTGCVR